MECDFCDYEWENRVESPKSCPKCKRRFDSNTNGGNYNGRN